MLRYLLAVVAMTAVFLVLAFTFQLSPGWFGLMGLVGLLFEKPMRRLSERLADTAARLRAEANADATEEQDGQ